MSFRSNPDYTVKQTSRVKILLSELESGVTVRDTLPNSAYPLKEEAEAMYFKTYRELLNTNYVRDIMDLAQDICDHEVEA